MTDIEKILLELYDYEPYARDLPCVTIKSSVFLSVFDLLTELEAKRLKNKPVKLLPCKCGCKRREHWYGIGSDKPEILKCERCGFSVAGKNDRDARIEWNKAVTQMESDVNGPDRAEDA